jgi:hypothetical protein
MLAIPARMSLSHSYYNCTTSPHLWAGIGTTACAARICEAIIVLCGASAGSKRKRDVEFLDSIPGVHSTCV